MGIGTCCSPLDRANAAPGKQKTLRIALAGNANVGKSALFNYLTGMSQHVANWPGKTVELAEGTAYFGNYEIKIIDLPGIYSFSTFSFEEEVTKEYIIKEKPDLIINVIDSTAIERNLFLTLQLLELGVPMVIALNQSDIAKRNGINIDTKKFCRLLGMPVMQTVATKGIGVYELLACCMETINRIKEKKTKNPRPNVPKRFSGSTAIDASSRRYAVANGIAAKVQTITKQEERNISEIIDDISTHRFFGYIIMLLVLGLVFYLIFSFGSISSAAISGFFDKFRPVQAASGWNLIWEGIIGGFVAGVTLVLPFVLPFYFLLSLLEDTGYITRVAYLLDGLAHKIGFHGKAIIPLILGYGCNVPACISCRIMEYDRDRFITAFAVTLIPCTARTAVILALVGVFLGPWWAIALYVFNLIVVAVLAKIAFRIMPGEPVGLIMEMPRYKLPSIIVALKQTMFRTKSLITIVFPYYMIGGLLIAILQLGGVIDVFNSIFEPVISGLLGLPAFTGTLLIFGTVRKELIVVLPSILYSTSDLAALFTPLQMIVLTVIAIFYIPCLATIEVLKREFGWKKAVFVTIFEIIFALALAGTIAHLLPLTGLI